jgi:hypothetical protein
MASTSRTAATWNTAAMTPRPASGGGSERSGANRRRPVRPLWIRCRMQRTTAIDASRTASASTGRTTTTVWELAKLHLSARPVLRPLRPAARRHVFEPREDRSGGRNDHESVQRTKRQLWPPKPFAPSVDRMHRAGWSAAGLRARDRRTRWGRCVSRRRNRDSGRRNDWPAHHSRCTQGDHRHDQRVLRPHDRGRRDRGDRRDRVARPRLCPEQATAGTSSTRGAEVPPAQRFATVCRTAKRNRMRPMHR